MSDPTVTLTLNSRKVQRYLTAAHTFDEAKRLCDAAEKAHERSKISGTTGTAADPHRHRLPYPKQEHEARNTAFTKLQAAEREVLKDLRRAAEGS